MSTRPIGALLVEAGVVTGDQLSNALGRQRSYGGCLATYCWQLGFADERSLAVVLSRQLGVPFAVLTQSAIPARLADELPRSAATKLGALPMRKEGRTLWVAMANPHDIKALDELRFGTGCRVVEHGALKGVLLGVIEELYDLHQRQATSFYTGPDLETSRVTGSQGHLEIVRCDELMVRGGARPAPAPTTGVDLSAGWSSAEVQRQPAPTTASGVRPSVLVVDDERDIRQILCEYLGKSGFSVRAATDGAEAMQMLQVELPDALVLDAMLPGVHGFDICRRVKQSAASRQVKVVMISAVYRGWRYADDIKRMYGADDFLEKPFRLEELKRALDQALQGDRSTASPEEMSAQASALLLSSAAAYRQGDKAQARELLQQAVALAPFSVDLNRRLGLLHEQLGDPYRAIAALERVAELETSYDNLLQLARLYERTGFRFKAFEAWERCLWLSPDADVTEKIRAHMGELMATG